MTEVEFIDIFSDNLRDVMKEQGYNVSNLSEAINVSESTISRYLNKQTMPTVKNLINICMETGIDLDDLIPFYERIY